jgi:hypothetical protein
MQEREENQHLRGRICPLAFSPAKQRFFVFAAAEVLPAANWGEERLSMYGGCEDKARGKYGVGGLFVTSDSCPVARKRSKSSWDKSRYSIEEMR